MKKLFYYSVVTVIILLFVSLTISCGGPKSTESVPQKTLSIGFLTALTGPGSEGLTLFAEGAKAAEHWINDNGGLTINGEKYRVQYLVEDTTMEPQGAVSAANRLLFDKQVKFICGPVVAFQSLAVASITEEAKILRLAGIGPGLPDEINNKLPLTFMQRATSISTPMAFNYLAETHPEVKKVAIICADEPGGYYCQDLAKREAEKHGLTVVLTETYPIGTPDFYPLWTKIIDSGADTLCTTIGITPWIAAILKQGRELNFQGPIFAVAAGDPLTLLNAAGKDTATNFFMVGPYIDSPDMPSVTKKIRQVLLDECGKASVEHIYGFEGLWYVTQAIEKAQSLDPVEVAKSWEEMKSIETPYGTGKMGGLETYGINHIVVGPEAITEFTNGELKHIKWFVPECP